MRLSQESSAGTGIAGCGSINASRKPASLQRRREAKTHQPAANDRDIEFTAHALRITFG